MTKSILGLKPFSEMTDKELLNELARNSATIQHARDMRRQLLQNIRDKLEINQDICNELERRHTPK